MRSYTKIVLLCVLMVTLMLGTTVALAAGGYQISWWTVDSGGGRSQSADKVYTLIGTIGQPDADFATGGMYTVHGGLSREQAC